MATSGIIIGSPYLNDQYGKSIKAELEWSAELHPDGNYSVVTCNFYYTVLRELTDQEKAMHLTFNMRSGNFTAPRFFNYKVISNNGFSLNSDEYLNVKQFSHTIQFSVNHNFDGTTLINFPWYTDAGDLPMGSWVRSYFDFTFYLDMSIELQRGTPILTATNFTDLTNPTITYNASAADIYKLEAAISFNASTDNIKYRDISISNKSYTFNLTEAEREAIRSAITNSNTMPVWFMLRTTYTDGSNYAAFATTLERSVTIAGCNPIVEGTVKDIKPETLALTGDENTFIRYESMAEFSMVAYPGEYATLVKQYVKCGNKIINDLPNGVIDDVESADFEFYALDSRGIATTTTVFKNLIEYVKPTCYQSIEIALNGETSAQVKLTASGNYYNGSFGVANNTLKLEVRHTDNNGDMGEWITLNGSPTFNNNTYNLEATLTGFDYGKAYTFQCRATDKLNVVQSAQYTVRLLPVFDWGEDDFNFNVPVNIEADKLNMYGNTIIRHDKSTKNTVLAANDGHIYIRPKGTDNTSGQTILYNNGNVDFSGAVNFGNTVNFDYSFTVGGYLLNDYVIESGSEAMGTNGTWYWVKWLNGRAEAWGCRNFGNMAVSTAWGSLYRSSVFTQNLPSGVFKRTPESININFVHTNAGGWISKYDNTAPSATTTGSFVVVRPVSGNITPTNIGFHIIGEWY